jgi:beta-lactamase class A
MKGLLSLTALLIGGAQLLLGLTAPAADEQKAAQPGSAGIAEIERDLQGHLGVAILDTANNKSIDYHATDRFPMCSTFKCLLAADVLERVDKQKERLDRDEPTLNTAIKGDERDTTTPAAMLGDLKSVLLDEKLSVAGRQRLEGWLVKNTTGDKRLRAGLPSTWQIGDKTGTGQNAARGDLAIARPPNRAPILIVVYTVESPTPDDQINATFAAIGKLVGEEF